MNIKQCAASVPKPIEGAPFDERFNGALVEHGRGNLFDEVVERGEGALRLAGVPNSLDNADPHVTDRGQTKANILTDRTESGNRLIHVRGKNLDSHPATFIEIDG